MFEIVAGAIVLLDDERPKEFNGCTVLYEDEFPMDLPPGKYVMASNVYMTPIELAYTLKNANLRGTPVETEDSADRIGEVSGDVRASALRLAIRRLLDRRRRRRSLRRSRTDKASSASEDYA